jgi:hypothetical protein
MRHDHTDWLIHFVRNRLPEQDFPGTTEEEAGFYQGGELEPDADAFSVLKTIVRLGGIIPGYSFRNGRTTIYGGGPAVCVTEMPLYSFAQYARARGDETKATAYGIAFLKSEFYAAGGRPVIYGLSTIHTKFTINTETVRIFEDSVLPQAEQYRYVAYNPLKKGRWVDWSHEREWRWVPQDVDADEVWVQDYNGIYGPTPALPIFKGRISGRPFTRVCIIVWTRDEAEEVRSLLTGFYLAGCNNYDTPFDRSLIEASRIIILQDVVAAVEKGGKLRSQTIEGIEEADLLAPITIPPPPAHADAIVKAAMDKAGAAAKAAVEAFVSKHGSGSSTCGFAHATTYEVTSPIVQYMLKKGLASGPYDGCVWISFPKNYPASQSMDYCEAGCRAAAKVLSAELGIKIYCATRFD